MFKENWLAYQTGHPQAHNQIAHRLNADVYAADYTSLQAAVDACKLQGSGRGGVVHLSPGFYDLDNPLMLPRSGADLANIVHLVGAGRGVSVIRGTVNFPASRVHACLAFRVNRNALQLRAIV
jgi:pectin methylesterase-like acyl-CoA thioesterase